MGSQHGALAPRRVLRGCRRPGIHDDIRHGMLRGVLRHARLWRREERFESKQSVDQLRVLQRGTSVGVQHVLRVGREIVRVQALRDVGGGGAAAERDVDAPRGAHAPVGRGWWFR